ncbi:MAG: glycosyltransferase family 39 protein [Acidobacteriota bacterium]|nr:MAG: glycosyltransferase family 39 protein [Acidobacteriota bacterium]
MAGSSQAAARFPLAAVTTIILLALGVGSLSLGRRDLWPPDEPKYALVAREMSETGEWLIPHVNGVPYPDKPPLMFWAIAAFGLLLGRIDQPAAVLPSLLSAPIVLAATARLAWRLDPQRRRASPMIATAALAISFQFMNQSVVGQLDMLLCAATTWSFLLLIEGTGWTENGPLRSRLVVGAFALMGVATLAKGPVGLLLPLGGVLLGSWLAGRKLPWRGFLRPGAWLVYAAVVAAWLAPAAAQAWRAGQGEWTVALLFEQTIVRYARSWHHHRPFWYLFAVPLYDFLPVVLALPAALSGLFANDAPAARAGRRLLAGACLFTLVFFSIPAGKRGLYLLPAYPWAAAWIALDLARRISDGGRSLWAVRAAGLTLGALLLPLALVAPWLGALLDEQQIPRAALGLAVPLGLAGGGGLIAGPARRVAPGLLAIAASMGAFYAGAFALVLPALNPRNSARVVLEQIAAATVPNCPGAMIDFRAQFGFYYGKRMRAAAPGDGPALAALAEQLAAARPLWVLCQQEHLQDFVPYLPSGALAEPLLTRRVGHKRYVVHANEAARRRAGPDPGAGSPRSTRDDARRPASRAGGAACSSCSRAPPRSARRFRSAS